VVWGASQPRATKCKAKQQRKTNGSLKGGGAPEPTAAPKARAPVLAPAPAAALALAPAPPGAIVPKRKQVGVWLSRFETGGETHKGGVRIQNLTPGAK